MRLTHSTAIRAVIAAAALATLGAAEASNEILVLTGSGSSSLNAPLTGAGFTVVNGLLAPEEISSKLTANTVGVYMWNDGSLGNTFSPVNPTLAFDAADQTALLAFASTHKSGVMDVLSWRTHANADEANFSKNEASLLASSGGGIVLGADDASALIVQHVNRIVGWLNYNTFAGICSTSPSNQLFGGSLLTTPNLVNPSNVVGTTTYSEFPKGLQPNGVYLSAAILGFNSVPLPACGPSPEPPSATVGGFVYAGVNRLVTTNIAGGGIDPPIPEPGTYALMGVGLAAPGVAVRRRSRPGTA